jgi:uncharacterized protein YcfL
MKALCFLFALLLIGCEAKEDRYKIITQGSVIMKIDTKTGQAWKWEPSFSGAGEWKPIQNPP